MKTNLIKLFALLFGLTPLAAAAQDSLDTDGDGFVSFDEVIAVHPDVTTDAFLSADQDGDQLLSTDELAAAQEAGLIPSGET